MFEKLFGWKKVDFYKIPRNNLNRLMKQAEIKQWKNKKYLPQGRSFPTVSSHLKGKHFEYKIKREGYYSSNKPQGQGGIAIGFHIWRRKRK